MCLHNNLFTHTLQDFLFLFNLERKVLMEKAKAVKKGILKRQKILYAKDVARCA